MIGIYCITNKINGKKYIGQSTNILSRWGCHLRRIGKYNKYQFYKDFEQYGISNFTFEILELCTKEELSHKEEYYINKFKTNINGYNLTRGGVGYWLPLNIEQKVKKEIIEDKISMTKIAKKYFVSPQTIWDINKGRIYFDDKLSYPLRNFKTNYQFKKVSQFDLQGNFIESFDSVKDALKKLKKKHTKVLTDCLNGSRPSAYGYIWRYLDDVKK